MPSSLVRLDETQRDLVERNVALVEHITHRVHARYGRHIEREELVHVGMLGLVEAAARFDTTRGIPFSTFAGLRIEGSIIDFLRRGDWLPRASRAFEHRVVQTERTLFERLGRPPTRAELAAALEITDKALEDHRARVATATIDSLDRDVRADSSQAVRLSEIIPDTTASIEEVVLERELLTMVRRSLRSLDERSRFVVVAYLLEGKSLKEIADRLGVTRSRVSQLKDEAVRRVRESIRLELREGRPAPRRAETPPARPASATGAA
jgi:RNA polymerase sigma factor for flagellar operon FliA